MKVCKINHCKTKSSDKDRSLFEAKGEDRQKWIPFIRAYQSLNESQIIYICDLHFHETDLVKNGKSLRPKKNAMPFINIIGHGQNERTFNSSDEEFTGNLNHSCGSSASSQEKILHNTITETDIVLISRETYRRLITTSIDLLKANNSIEKLKEIIRRKDALIEQLKTNQTDHLTPGQKDVLDCLMNRSSGSRSKYSPETRSFCLRIQFHSTAAYNELRKFFGNRLPTRSTLQKWLRCADASPGITQMAIDEIAEKVKEYRKKGNKLFLTLMSDDIAIRKQIEWNEITKNFSGFSTETNTNSDAKLPTSKEALVFMAVGSDFKIPIAYFFINGLQAMDRAVLTREVIIAVSNSGATVVSLTGDGLAANVAVAKILGTDFNSKKTYFPNPVRPNEKIYVIFDPPHMIKLIRRYFAYQQLYYKDDKLKWELLEKIAEKQDKDNFELGNNLSRSHINFKEAPMNVLLAVQTMSNSVADTLEQMCEDKYEDFIGCEPTIKFLRLCNNVYDAMNYSECKPSNDHFKKPMCAANIQKFRYLFQEFEDFVNQITVEEIKRKKMKEVPPRKPVLKSKSSMGFFGLLTNVQSTLGIYADYVENGPLDVFYTFQYSQDHLETYFSLIRSNLGWNNNPNEIQFKASYRKLLVCMPYLSARKGNCILNSTNILTVSSSQQSEHRLSYQPSLHQVHEEEIDNAKFQELLFNTELEPYEEHMQAFVTATVQENIMRKISKRSLSACQDCFNVFNENPKICDAFVAKKSQTKKLAQPCASSIHIIAACNAVFELLESRGHVPFNATAITIFNHLDTNELYESSIFHTHKNPTLPIQNFTHKENFIFDIIIEYMNIKSKKIGKCITIEEKNGRAVRRNLTRSIILAGQ